MENMIWVIYLIDVVCGSWSVLGFLLMMGMLISGGVYRSL